MGAVNGNGDGRLERIAENATLKLGARVLMWACPLVCTLIGALITAQLNDIKHSAERLDFALADLNKRFNAIEISAAVAAVKTEATDKNVDDLKRRIEQMARQP